MSFPRNFNPITGTVIGPYNPDDFRFKQGNATLQDLEDCAKVNESNVFTNTNYFTDIFVRAINGLSYTVLSYLSNITEDVQSGLNRSQNLTYDIESGNTHINNATYADRLTVESFNCKKVATLTVQTQTVTSNKIISRSALVGRLVCDSFEAKNFLPVGAYIFLENGRNVPIIKGGTIITAMPSLIIQGKPVDSMTCEITLLPGYMITFYDNVGNVLYFVDNTSGNDVMYSYCLRMPKLPYKFDLFFNNKKVIF
jgi:hypothetical protein